MEKYKHTATEAQKIILAFIKERMKEKKVTQNKLADLLDVSVTTLVRYFKQETPMPLTVYLEICGILELRPYLIAAEYDQREMKRIYFN